MGIWHLKGTGGAAGGEKWEIGGGGPRCDAVIFVGPLIGGPSFGAGDRSGARRQRGVEHVGDRGDQFCLVCGQAHGSSSRRASSSRLTAEMSASTASAASVSCTRRRTASAIAAGT